MEENHLKSNGHHNGIEKLIKNGYTNGKIGSNGTIIRNGHLKHPSSDTDTDLETEDENANENGIEQAQGLIQRKKTKSVVGGKVDKNVDSEYEGELDISSGYAFHCCGGRLSLFGIEEMPPYLQFNKHVHSGYRGLMTVPECLKSLFYLHNETVNIFTHVLPIILVALFWHKMFPWGSIKGNFFLNFLGYTHILGSVSPWIGSVCYHLFMPLRHGHKMYKRLLQFDMLGIWFTETFGAMTLLTATVWCLPTNLQIFLLVAYSVTAAIGLWKALTSKSPLSRRMCFAGVFISRFFAFFLRLSSYGGGDPNALVHIILQDAVSIFGGVIGVIRIPEKWFPGKLDMFFNSHHIMHVLVVLAILHMNAATNSDVHWIMNNWSQCSNNNNSTLRI